MKTSAQSQTLQEILRAPGSPATMTRIATRVRPVALRPTFSDGLPFSGLNLYFITYFPPLRVAWKDLRKENLSIIQEMELSVFRNLLVMSCCSYAV